jgi:integrase
MACVKKRTKHGQERYVVDWRDAQSRRRLRVFRTRREADEHLAQVLREARQPARPVVPTTITVEDYATGWLGIVAAQTKPRTHASYEQLLRVHILPPLGPARVRELHRGRIKALLATKLEAGLSRNTVRLVLATLRAMLQAAVDDGVLLANPALRLGRSLRLITSAKARQEHIKAFTPEQFGIFLHTAERRFPRLARLWLLQARSGLRPGEAYALEWDDLDLDARDARVTKTLSDDGKRIDTPKSNHGRTVDLSTETAAMLRQLHAHRTAETLRRGGGTVPALVFCSETGTHLDPATVRHAFRKVLRSAGLPTHFTPHCLRHTYASQLLSLGESIYYVQRQLGHASIQLTVDTYGKWLPAGNKNAVDRLDALARSVGSPSAVADGASETAAERGLR